MLYLLSDSDLNKQEIKARGHLPWDSDTTINHQQLLSLVMGYRRFLEYDTIGSVRDFEKAMGV